MKTMRPPVLSLLTLLLVACTPKSSVETRPDPASCRDTFTACLADLERGMSMSEVEQLLGAPDQMTRDSNDIDTWLYFRDGNRFKLWFFGLSFRAWCSGLPPGC